MAKFSVLTPSLAVAGALSREDFREAARLGFKAIINNRPDHEEAGQLTAREEAVLARQAGLAYRHVPVAKHEVLEPHALEMQSRALRSLPGPVLVHCRSGLRPTIMWAAASVSSGTPVADALAEAARSGHDLSSLSEEIGAFAVATHREDQLDDPIQAAAA